MVIHFTASNPQADKDFNMFTTAKTAAAVVTLVAIAHFAAFGSAASALQVAADRAVMPIVKAEPIIVRVIQVVHAERIEVRASRAA